MSATAITRVDALDHSMFVPEGRRGAKAVLQALLATDDFGSPASIPPTPEATSR